MKKTKINILGTYKLKHTLYPDIDGYYTHYKEDWYECSGDTVLRKGSIFNLVSKEDFCKQHYEGEEAEGFMDFASDFTYVAYMKSNYRRYIIISSLQDFEEVKNG